MHCDKEFKESAEERFHPDPSLTTEERETDREREEEREREKGREREGERERRGGGGGRERPGKGFDRAHRLTPFVAV